jgi:CBS domain-containing protein
MGMVSRIDVFRSVQLHYDRQTAEVEEPKPGRSVTELMYTDAPTVGPNATLEEIVRALEASRRRRVIVVDDERRVLGIITDGDLLRRSQQRQHPGLLERLRRLVVGEPATVGPDGAPQAVNSKLATNPNHTSRRKNASTLTNRLLSTPGI